MERVRINDAAMAYLANGHWPELRCLTLYGNDISVQGVQLLTAGQWPWLHGLILDSNTICTAMVNLLNLVWGAEPDYMYRYIGSPGCSVAWRVVSKCSPGNVWPELKRVEFMCDHVDIGSTKTGCD